VSPCGEMEFRTRWRLHGRVQRTVENSDRRTWQETSSLRSARTSGHRVLCERNQACIFPSREGIAALAEVTRDAQAHLGDPCAGCLRRRAPYAVALVDFDEGPRLYTNVVGAAPDEVAIGQRVTVDFTVGDGVSRFRAVA
jgi:hypothetical protein